MTDKSVQLPHMCLEQSHVKCPHWCIYTKPIRPIRPIPIRVRSSVEIKNEIFKKEIVYEFTLLETSSCLDMEMLRTKNDEKRRRENMCVKRYHLGLGDRVYLVVMWFQVPHNDKIQFSQIFSPYFFFYYFFIASQKVVFYLTCLLVCYSKPHPRVSVCVGRAHALFNCHSLSEEVIS